MKKTDHRDWEMPSQPWIVRQDWTELSFLHWKISPEELRKHVPEPLELDLYQGEAYIGVVPFRMDKVRFSYTPPVYGVSSFPELNVRTYVRYKGKQGVFFFSLDAKSHIMVWVGRRFFQLPYHHATMKNQKLKDGWRYTSIRNQNPNKRFIASQIAQGEEYLAEKGTLLHFLTERYCLYFMDQNARPNIVEVHHAPWPVRDATITIEENSVLSQFGIENPLQPDLVHCSRGVEVASWWPEAL